MKKAISIVLVIAMCMSFASCSVLFGNKLKDNKPVSDPETFTFETMSDEHNDYPAYRPSPTEAQTEPPVTEPETEAFDEDSIYRAHIAANPARYAEYDGEPSTFEPLYYYFDLDDDSVDELVYFIQIQYYYRDYPVTKGYVYMFDIIDGEVVEFFGSTEVAAPRMNDTIRVFKENGQFYITKDWNDGNYIQKGTLYTYDGQRLVVDHTIYGMYNDPSFYEVSYLGTDIFDGYEETSYTAITEDEFELLQDRIRESEEELFNSDDCFRH